MAFKVVVNLVCDYDFYAESALYRSAQPPCRLHPLHFMSILAVTEYVFSAAEATLVPAHRVTLYRKIS